MIKRWTKDGCLDTIAKGLGYRYVVTRVDRTSSPIAGGPLTVQIQVENRGFAPAYSDFTPTLALVSASSGARVELPNATFDHGVREWAPGVNVTVTASATLPPGLAPGSYKVVLQLKLNTPGKTTDSRNWIQFANTGIFDPANGDNTLATITTGVSSGAVESGRRTAISFTPSGSRARHSNVAM